jgi:hypothetical protein
MRLRGKADRIRRHGIKAFEVRDFKSGATLDENGMVKADIALQLQAYGLILLEKHRDAEIRLVVDDGVEREVAFDAEARHSARESIARVTNAMPPVGEAMADTLMRPGNGCWGCAVRHVCPGYRQIAPTWWKEYPRELDRASNDVWGTVIEVHGCGRVDVVLRDDAGRRVRVDGVDEKHGIIPAMVGMRLWFFELEATGASRGFDGTRFHPRTFHELPRDRMERRAWSLHVFAEDDRERGEPALAVG